MSPWDNKEFVGQWNTTYGLDMLKAPIRPGIVWPLLAKRICWPQNKDQTIRIADFGCGNGNLIRAFINRPFVEWLGIDSGQAILDTARPLEKEVRVDGTRVVLWHKDIGQPIPTISDAPGFDHVVSVFTLEEIPAGNAAAFYANMAKAVKSPNGDVHIFTQHPAYALQQDTLSRAQGKPNEKFQGHEGYFDGAPVAYTLSVLNGKNGVEEKPTFHHKTFANIVNGLANAGLFVREMVEIPAGVLTVEELESHVPKRGDVPRFLYLRASYFPSTQ
jgi:SAM-dependent methyltransferase